MGLIDGVLLAPFFGAPKDNLAWLEECVTGMKSSQTAAIFSAYLDGHPARWHQGAHVLFYYAMRDACENP